MPDPTIVFIGDSITKATDYGVLPNEAFAHLIGTACGYAHSRIYNKGVASDTSGGVLTRWDTDVTSYNPTRAVLMIGANDFAQSIPVTAYQANLVQIALKCAAKDLPLTIISSNLVRGDVASVNAWNPYLQALEEVVAQFSLPYVDFNREMIYTAFRQAHLPLYVDMVHLTPAGHAYLTEFCTRPIHRGKFL